MRRTAWGMLAALAAMAVVASAMIPFRSSLSEAMTALVLVIPVIIGVVVGGLWAGLVSVVAGHFFGGHDAHVAGSGGHAEAGADSSDMPGISIFSPTIMAAFVTAFGGFGSSCPRTTRSTASAVAPRKRPQPIDSCHDIGPIAGEEGDVGGADGVENPGSSRALSRGHFGCAPMFR